MKNSSYRSAEKKLMLRLRMFWQRFLDFISHPGWNGLSCIITALGALGLGGYVLAKIIVAYKYLADIYFWAISPVELPRFLLFVGVIVLFALILTTIIIIFSNRHHPKLEIPSIASNIDSQKFDPTPLDIEIMKQLAVANELNSHWVEESAICDMQNLSGNRVYYYLKNLKKQGIVHQHMIDGGWGILDDGIEYLIEHNHI